MSKPQYKSDKSRKRSLRMKPGHNKTLERTHYSWKDARHQNRAKVGFKAAVLKLMGW